MNGFVIKVTFAASMFGVLISCKETVDPYPFILQFNNDDVKMERIANYSYEIASEGGLLSIHGSVDFNITSVIIDEQKYGYDNTIPKYGFVSVVSSDTRNMTIIFDSNITDKLRNATIELHPKWDKDVSLKFYQFGSAHE